MGKLHNNESGFSIVEAIMALIIVILIAVVGGLVYKNHNKASSNSVTKTTSTSSAAASTAKTAATNPYTGWKQYCSTVEKSCFKYPSTWTFADSCTASTPCFGADNVGVASPSNSQINFTSAITGRGGDCAGAPDSFITSVAQLPDVKGLYLIQFSRADVGDINIGVDDTVDGSVPKTGDTGGCFMYTQFNAKNTPNAQAALSGQVPDSAKNADLNDALLIIKSYYYR